MPPVDLSDILSRAVSGAARTIDSVAYTARPENRGIALSDGSRIIFASVDDVRVLTDA